MKKKIAITIVLAILLSITALNTSPAFADSVLDGYEIINLPDRIALTDEPITFSSLQYVASNGTVQERELRLFEFISPKKSKVIELVQDTEIDDYWGKPETKINSITLIPKSVGCVTIHFDFVFDYYKTIYVYDPDMASAERDTPQNLKVKKFTPKKLSVSWDPVYGAKEYTVFRSKTGKDGTFKKIKTTSKTSFTDKGLTSGKTYYYKVKALTQDGLSNASEIKKCRVSRKLNITVDMFNRVGRSTSIIKVHITNNGVGTFKVDQEIENVGLKDIVFTSLYYPHRGSSSSAATLINGNYQPITGLNIKKCHTGVARFSLDTYRIPSNEEHIIFNAVYDGVAYNISAHRNGTIFYSYNSFGIDGNYNDDTLYQLR